MVKMVKTNEMVRQMPTIGDRRPAEENDPEGSMRTNFTAKEISSNPALRAMLASGKSFASSDYMATKQKQNMSVDYFAATDKMPANREAMSMQIASRNLTYEAIGSKNINMHTVDTSKFRSGIEIEEEKFRTQRLRTTVSDPDAMRKQVRAAKTALGAYLPM